MFSSGENVSPVIDTQRCSLFLIHNNIDLQDSANSADVLANRANSPINFADETTATGGTHLAKHVVKPVQLAQPAVGLKILIAANRPSVTDFDVYYKATTNDVNFEDIDWTEVSKETPIASDDNPNIFRDYTYLVGAGTGLSTPFTKFIIKIVQKSSNSAKVVTFKDLRVIALAV
jgi:peptidoglycan hydrolase-like protein with peptidoglycan-binding domain